ncbi:hypothetical protein HNV12_00755 [Methanococcoides sp. SA1]|nr:hypothetical protein [Methanococcoides sp. SA1]
MVKIDLQKRDFVWLLILFGVSVVFAYGSSNPSVMGHSTGEMSYRSMCEGACDSPSIDRPGGGVGQVVVDDPFYVSNNMYVGGKFAAASVSDAFCRLITGHNCGYDTDTNTDTNTNAVTICDNDKFLDGDGQCKTSAQIVSAGGGSGDTKMVTGSNPVCDSGYQTMSRKWTTASCSNFGGTCSLYRGWSGAPPQCESCANWEKCHMCKSVAWDAVYCVK